MSALRILHSYRTSTYPETTSLIHQAARLIYKPGNYVILHWVSNHVGIQGNEKADEAAEDATRNL